jgi:hypothetical protein
VFFGRLLLFIPAFVRTDCLGAGACIAGVDPILSVYLLLIFFVLFAGHIEFPFDFYSALALYVKIYYKCGDFVLHFAPMPQHFGKARHVASEVRCRERATSVAGASESPTHPPRHAVL